MPRKKAEPEEVMQAATEAVDVQEQVPAAEEPTPQEAPSERRSFYQLDFNELDRDLSPEERQEWNSIYASYRSRSVLTGSIVGIDRHELNTRDRESGEAVIRQMYCKRKF